MIFEPVTTNVPVAADVFAGSSFAPVIVALKVSVFDSGCAGESLPHAAATSTRAARGCWTSLH